MVQSLSHTRKPVLDPSASTRMHQRPRGREVGAEQSALSRFILFTTQGGSVVCTRKR